MAGGNCSNGGQETSGRGGQRGPLAACMGKPVAASRGSMHLTLCFFVFAGLDVRAALATRRDRSAGSPQRS
jgi:hypothetical protein